MELFNLENGRVLRLQSGILAMVGRGPDSGISSLSVSRNHCTVLYVSNSTSISTCGKDEAQELAGSEPDIVDVRLTVAHPSGAAVMRGSYARRLGLEPLSLLAAKATCQLYAGDRVYLERRDERLVSGLELRAVPPAAAAVRLDPWVSGQPPPTHEPHRCGARQGSGIAASEAQPTRGSHGSVTHGPVAVTRVEHSGSIPVPMLLGEARQQSPTVAAPVEIPPGAFGAPLAKAAEGGTAAPATVKHKTDATAGPAAAAEAGALQGVFGNAGDAKAAESPLIKLELSSPRRRIPPSFRREQFQATGRAGAAAALAAATPAATTSAAVVGFHGNPGRGSPGAGGGGSGRAGPAAKRRGLLPPSPGVQSPPSPPPRALHPAAASTAAAEAAETRANLNSAASLAMPTACRSDLSGQPLGLMSHQAALLDQQQPQPRHPSKSSPPPQLHDSLCPQSAAAAAAAAATEPGAPPGPEEDASLRGLQRFAPPAAEAEPTHAIKMAVCAAAAGGGGGGSNEPTAPALSERLSPSPASQIQKSMSRLMTQPDGDLQRMMPTPVPMAAVTAALCGRGVAPAPAESVAVDGAVAEAVVLLTVPELNSLPPVTSAALAGASSSAAAAAAAAAAAMAANAVVPAAAAAAAAASPSPSKQDAAAAKVVGGAVGGMFRGCRFVFWSRSSCRDVLAKVKQLGGREQYSLGPCTTHVVGRFDTSAEEAAQLLRSSDLGYDIAAAAAAPASTSSLYLPPGVLFVTPEYLRDCLSKGRRLEPDPAAGHLIQLATCPSEPPLPMPPQLPPPPPASVPAATAALSFRHAQPPKARFLPPPLPLQQLSPQLQRQLLLPQQEVQSITASRNQGRSREEEGASGKRGTAMGGASPLQPPLKSQLPEILQGQSLGSNSAGAAAVAAGPARDADQQEEGEWSAIAAAAIAAAAAAAAASSSSGGGLGGSEGSRVLPGPADICMRPEDWGVEDRWIEPWDHEAASRTCMLLLRHWAKHSYQTDGDSVNPDCAPAAGGGGAGEPYSGGGGSGGDGSDGDDARGRLAIAYGRPRAANVRSPVRGGDGSWWRRRRSDCSSSGFERSDEETEGVDGAGTNADNVCGGGVACTAMAATAADQRPRRQHGINVVCGHSCCAARPFCLLAELRRTRDLYLGREDQFRIKAIDRAMSILVRMDRSLDSPDQLRQLRLGKGTEEKVAEILATGRLRRNLAFEQNEQRMAMMKFMQVWGCGESTARSWWASGARCLGDVRRRRDLTAQQRLGLRHFEDFQRRLLRSEVAQVASVVRHVTIEVLRDLTRLPDAALLDRLHVRPMGSYARGSASCADVDFIIAPSPQADPRVSPYQLLVAILDRLEAGAYLDPESAHMIQTRQDHFRSPHRTPIRTRRHPDLGLLSQTRSSPRSDSAASGSEPSSGARKPKKRRHVHAHDYGHGQLPDEHGAAAGGGGCGSDEMESASWLGVWRNPVNGRYCRVDIKCYYRRLLPFAVNYFSSGRDFNRALRYWGSVPLPHVRQLAQALHPRAEAFKLSDKELALLERREAAPGTPGHGFRSGLVEYILATVPCRCETDIFHALGLDYVPPHMRDITHVE